MAGQPAPRRSTTRTSASTSSRSATAPRTASLYSRGFASIYGEWETTAEAKQRAPHVPRVGALPRCPPARCRWSLKKRDAQNALPRGLVGGWSIRPTRAIDRAGPPAAQRLGRGRRTARPRDKVDLLLLGDGYTAAEMDKWHADARRLAELLFAVSPFKERRADFNVWALDTPSDASGVSRPSDGVYRRSRAAAPPTTRSAPSATCSPSTTSALREVAAAAPYEFVEIVVNDRKYGGGGIYNLYATVAADNAFTPYVFVHEFGHHFAGLADEYYTSDVAYDAAAERPEPWEPNVTADPPAPPKWKDLVHAGHAAADAVEQGGVRGACRRRSRPAGGRSAPRSGPRRRWTRSSARSSRRDDAAARAGRRTRGRWAPSRGRIYEAQGLLPAAGRLHHVHARPGGVLRGLPARHRARHRPLRGRAARPLSAMMGGT